LAHELAHILRKDYILNVMINVITSFFYFHPGIWWIHSFLEQEREKATDELALLISGQEKITYAKSLYAVQLLSRKIPENSLEKKASLISPGLAFFGRNMEFLKRIENVLDQKRSKNYLIQRILSALLLGSFFLVMGFSDIIVPERKSYPAFQSTPVKENKKIAKQVPRCCEDKTEVKIIVRIDEECKEDGKTIISDEIMKVNEREIQLEIEVKSLADGQLLSNKEPLELASLNIEREILSDTKEEHKICINQKIITAPHVQFFDSEELKIIVETKHLALETAQKWISEEHEALMGECNSIELDSLIHQFDNEHFFSNADTLFQDFYFEIVNLNKHFSDQKIFILSDKNGSLPHKNDEMHFHQQNMMPGFFEIRSLN